MLSKERLERLEVPKESPYDGAVYLEIDNFEFKIYQRTTCESFDT